MNNATTIYYQWNSPIQIPQATIPTVSTVGRVCRVDATPQRPQRNSKRQPKICTERGLANGFLNTQFLPKLQITQEQEKLSKKAIQRREREFYNSLSQLAKYYGILPMQTAHFEYPYNIALAHWDIKRKLNEKLTDAHEVCITQTTENKTFLSVSETYNTDNYLYYVPVYSLFQMLKDKNSKQTKELLFSVFSYLYRNIGIPFYREEDAYLYYMYDMTKEWIIEGEMYDEDDEDKEQILREIAQCEYIGDTVLKKIQNEENSNRWKQRLQSFCVKNDFDSELFIIAEQFYKLWEDYPHESIFRYANYEECESRDDCLSMDKSLSFACSFEGLLYEQINEILNNDLSVYSEMQEPTLYRIFNGKDIPKQNFDFEHRFFNLIDKLISLLN